MNVISDNKVCVEEEGFCYTIIRLDDFETNNSFGTRIQYIKKKNPKTKEEFEKVLKYSEIYANMMILGCDYSNKIKKLVL